MMLTLKEEINKLLPEGWLKDELSTVTGYIRYYSNREQISEEELDVFLTELSNRGIIVKVERRDPWIYIDVLRRFPIKKASSKKLHLILFIVTFFTLAFTGAEFLGQWIFDGIENVFWGIPYAFSLLTILAVHEAGHYFYATKYRVPASLPYFLPFYLPGLFHLGTFGAFIKMQGQMINRRALLEIGLYGPIWGFITSLIVLSVGFATFPDYQGMADYINHIHPFPMPEGEGVNIYLGSNLLFQIFKWLFNAQHLPMNEFYHFPLIFAGWVGTVVTALNLLPVGQLDGGHLTYGLMKERARYIGIAFIGILVVLSFFTSGWTMWVLLLVFLVRTKHPPTMDDDKPIDEKSKYLAYVAIAIFILCFVPVPFEIV